MRAPRGCAGRWAAARRAPPRPAPPPPPPQLTPHSGMVRTTSRRLSAHAFRPASGPAAPRQSPLPACCRRQLCPGRRRRRRRRRRLWRRRRRQRRLWRRRRWKRKTRIPSRSLFRSCRQPRLGAERGPSSGRALFFVLFLPSPPPPPARAPTPPPSPRRPLSPPPPPFSSLNPPWTCSLFRDTSGNHSRLSLKRTPCGKRAASRMCPKCVCS